MPGILLFSERPASFLEDGRSDQVGHGDGQRPFPFVASALVRVAAGIVGAVEAGQGRDGEIERPAGVLLQGEFYGIGQSVEQAGLVRKVGGLSGVAPAVDHDVREFGDFDEHGGLGRRREEGLEFLLEVFFRGSGLGVCHGVTSASINKARPRGRVELFQVSLRASI